MYVHFAHKRRKEDLKKYGRKIKVTLKYTSGELVYKV